MRQLIERKCASHAAFRFVVAEGGRVCCAGDATERMCPECRKVVTAARPAMRPQRTELPPLATRQQGADTRSYGRGPLERRAETVPPPPSLGDRIRESRARAGKSVAELAGEHMRRQMREAHRREFGR